MAEIPLHTNTDIHHTNTRTHTHAQTHQHPLPLPRLSLPTPHSRFNPRLHNNPRQHLIQGWDFGAPQVPFVNVPAPRATDAHEKPRRTLTAQEQTHRFLTEGVVYNACGGACHGDGGYL